ncbi:hypothetical protein ACFBZI_10675 [Moraxella sp. ZJ142]|uniref:hypothetical protein n=1 Tax=Moraxella marmotae TaxID=3344520 RepID=UPI0035D45BA7
MNSKQGFIYITIPYSWVVNHIKLQGTLPELSNADLNYLVTDYQASYADEPEFSTDEPVFFTYVISQDNYWVGDVAGEEPQEYLCNSVAEFIEMVSQAKTNRLLGINHETT